MMAVNCKLYIVDKHLVLFGKMLSCAVCTVCTVCSVCGTLSGDWPLEGCVGFWYGSFSAV
jgi:hypothetical protein